MKAKVERRTLLHVVNTHKKEKFQKLLENTQLSLPAAYGLFWLLIEETAKPTDLKIHINDLPEYIPIEFVRAVVDAELINFDGDFLSSRFIQQRHNDRLLMKTKLSVQSENNRKEIDDLKTENTRLNKLLKFKIKK